MWLNKIVWWCLTIAILLLHVLHARTVAFLYYLSKIRTFSRRDLKPMPFLISFNKQVLLKNFIFSGLVYVVSKSEERGFGLSKISSRLKENRRWQPVVLVEEELNHLSISTVIFSKDIVLLHNHRKDVWYFHQKILL